MSGQSDGVIAAAITVLGGGAGKFVYDWWRDRKQRPRSSPTQRRQADIDASILTVARARDELESDNVALRQMLAEEREAHRADNAAAEARETAFRREIDALEEKLRGMLGELAELRSRHSV